MLVVFVNAVLLKLATLVDPELYNDMPDPFAYPINIFIPVMLE